MRTNTRVLAIFVSLAVAFVLGIIPFTLGPYPVLVVCLIFLFILPTISMRVSFLAGQTNIGVIGFFAIGGYTAGALALKLQVPFLATILSGGVMAAVVGILLGSLIMNLGDLYFLIITWGFLELVRSAAIKLTPLTGGPFGLVNIPPISVGGRELSETAQYFLLLAFALVVLAILYRFEYSRLGLTWKSSAQAPELAEAIGINVHRFKLISFVVSCFVAGVGGALYAHFMGILQPATFSFLLATTVIIWNFIGGVRHFVGPVIGAVVLLVAVEPLRSLESYEMITYAGVIILGTVFLPDGLISLPRRFREMREYIRRVRGLPVGSEEEELSVGPS